MIREFADHLASDVKQLVEDEDTGVQSYRYVRTGVNHYSLAFAYDCIAWSRDTPFGAMISCSEYDEIEHRRNKCVEGASGTGPN